MIMKLTTAVVATLGGLAAVVDASSAGYRNIFKNCEDFSIDGLNGDFGRAMVLRATCRGITSELDLNTCFGCVSLFFFFPCLLIVASSVPVIVNIESSPRDSWGNFHFIPTSRKVLLIPSLCL